MLRLDSDYEHSINPRIYSGQRPSAVKEEDAAKFRDCLDWSEPVNQATPHSLLAMLRRSTSWSFEIAGSSCRGRWTCIFKELFIKRRCLAARQLCKRLKRVIEVSSLLLWKIRLRCNSSSCKGESNRGPFLKPKAEPLRTTARIKTRLDCRSGGSNRLQACS